MAKSNLKFQHKGIKNIQVMIMYSYIFFLHISVKMVNLEDMQLLSSLQYYFITWFGDSIVGIENSRHFNEKLC